MLFTYYLFVDWLVGWLVVGYIYLFVTVCKRIDGIYLNCLAL